MNPDEASETSEPSVEPATNQASGPSRRSLRVMAIVRWVLLALVTVLAATTLWTYWGPGQDQHAAHGADRYYCPMHPQIRSPDPGECPICQMTLVPIPEARHSPGTEPSSPGYASPANVTAVTVPEDKQRAVGMATTLVESTTLGDRLRVPGVLSAPETGRAEVRVRAPGFVEQVAIRQTGVKVSAGQALAFVYSPDVYRAQEEFLAVSRWNAGAPTSGANEGAGTDIAAASRRSLELLGLSSAEIDQVSRTGQPIRATAVRAPAGGFVTRASAVLGSRADPEMILYEITDLSKLWLVASVQERDLGAMKLGTEARFTISGGGSPLVAKVDLIEPMLEESTRSARVRLVLKNAEGNLRPGQFGEVEFDLPSTPGLFVPRDAVIRTGEHDYVYVATAGDRFEPRSVTTGVAREGRIQVLTGLSAGDRVVTRGSFMLDSESRLQSSLSATPAPARAPGSRAPEQGTP